MNKEIVYIVTGYEYCSNEEYPHILCGFATEEDAKDYIDKYKYKNVYCCMEIEEVEIYVN